ncbi:MAG: class I mannose-6-phosphate isomerase [Chitinispirillaceae bacterium]|nr:class I mannose-6-phosphate isomerase [Chitinispirillaceae bacterium]
MTLPEEPLFFEPIYKERIWGGTALGSRLNRRLPQGSVIGESWEIVSHGADQSRVCRGPLKGAPLTRLMTEAGLSLTGKMATIGTFPLLNKFIDARDRLSVQVHPDDRHARTYGWGEFGKTECWYVVNASDNARIITGFNKDVTKEEILRAIETATLDRLLRFTPVKTGDLVFVPGGTVHAILEGSLIYEVQETSDTTLRLYDWGRVDRTGTPRTLHVHDALKVLDSRARGTGLIPPVVLEENGHCRSFCIACRYFALEHYLFRRAAEIILPAKQSFRIVTAINGDLALRYPEGVSELPLGSTALLPAILRDVRARGTAGSEILVTSIPDLHAEVILPLRERGISMQAIESIGGFPGYNDLVPLLYS